jgi:DNA-binding NarL/FixJ family response regulator
MFKKTDKPAVEANKGDTLPCRLVILDDQPIFCEGVKRLLEQQENLKIAGIFDRKAAAFNFLHNHEADLLLLELNLRHEVGLELVKDLRAEFNKLRILVFTDRDEMIYGERALLAGAQGYLMKNSSPEMLVEVISNLMRDEVYLSEPLLAYLLKRIYMGNLATKGAPANPVAALSDREFEVFEMIGRGQGTRQIAACLKLSVKTVENHREKVKKKLGMDSGSSLVHYATIWVHESTSGKEKEASHDSVAPPACKVVTMPMLRVAWSKEARA